jgi:hypothetical protein
LSGFLWLVGGGHHHQLDLVFGASWGSTGQIVFATQMGGLWRVPASGGGKPELVTKPQPGEISHRLPQLLPDGQTVLFTSTKSVFPKWDDTRIVAQSLATGQQKVLIEGGADARYVNTGHLLFMRRGTLMAVPFDVTRLEVTGDAVGLLADVMQAADIQPVQIDSGAGVAVSESRRPGVRGAACFRKIAGRSSGSIARKNEPLDVLAGEETRCACRGWQAVVFNTTTGWDLSIYDVVRDHISSDMTRTECRSLDADSSNVAFSSGFSEPANSSFAVRTVMVRRNRW